MKFASLATAALTFALPAFAQVATTLSYDTVYDNASLSLAEVACSDGIYGLINQGFTTLGSLPDFPYIGGVYTVTGWDSPYCGTCYQVTYTNPATNMDTTVTIMAVDVSLDGLNVSEEAMNALTGGLAVELGRVAVTVVQVDNSVCGI